MQLVKTLFIAAIALTLCFAPTDASATVGAKKATAESRKLYYTRFPTPSPVANGRKLYYTRFPTPSPVVNGRKLYYTKFPTPSPAANGRTLRSSEQVDHDRRDKKEGVTLERKLHYVNHQHMHLATAR